MMRSAVPIQAALLQVAIQHPILYILQHPYKKNMQSQSSLSKDK